MTLIMRRLLSAFGGRLPVCAPHRTLSPDSIFGALVGTVIGVLAGFSANGFIMAALHLTGESPAALAASATCRTSSCLRVSTGSISLRAHSHASFAQAPHPIRVWSVYMGSAAHRGR